MYNLEKTIFNIKEAVKNSIKLAIEKDILKGEKEFNFEVEVPTEKGHGDLTTNVALVSSKIFRTSPRNIAQTIVDNIDITSIDVEKIEIAGPGFINFYLKPDFFVNTLKEIKTLKDKYGILDYGKKEKVMVEFVSANPTGPMHMGNARLGALGDCLSSILKKAGYDVFKEFYVNDAGNQIEKFGLSLDVRYRQICGDKELEMPEECYQGQDIIDLAQDFFNEYSDKYINLPFEERKKALVDFSLPKNISRMKKDMEKYKIIYDNWFYESDLHKNGEVDKIINLLTEKGYTYEKDGSVWYKSTEFGLEKDDVLRRQNGIPTYFAADIAYHYNKFVTRGFSKCIDIWGADHHGHVARMKGSMDALDIGGNKLEILLVQLVRLLKNGEIVRMSKRTGKAIQLSDLIDEVGADSARFIFNTHEACSGMDFDLDLAVKEDSQNPVYYVKYAHARLCSIFRQAVEKGIDLNDIENADLSLLIDESEKNIIFFMSMYPAEILKSAINYDPTKIIRYVILLATLFHKFYSSCKVISEDAELTKARLYLCETVKILIKDVLDMFKVEAPEAMN